VTHLAACDGPTLMAQARAVGFEPLASIVIDPTLEHVGTEIVCLEVPA
jgi:hypothetical protein